MANRVIEQNGLYISGNNIKLNFNESFKNVAQYYHYFDRSDFIYTGNANENELLMRFENAGLSLFRKNNLQFPQKFAHYAFQWKRLTEDAYQIIKANEDYRGPDLTYDAGLGY